MSSETERLVFAQDLIGSNKDPRIEAKNLQPGIYNFFQGNDPAKWRTGVRAYAEVTYREVWDGIDLKLYGKGQDLEQEFIVKPGADISQIHVAYRGIEGLRLADDGSLLIKTAFGEFRESQPHIYQEINGQSVEVSGRFKLVSETAYTFDVGPYQRQYALVIDPTLVWSTYLGGSNTDSGRAVAVGSFVHVTGRTLSTDFPNVGPILPFRGNFDAFVAAFTSESSLQYFTYLGGSGADLGRGIATAALDFFGNAYVTGQTSSTDFPTTAGAFQSSFGGGANDVFVAKFDGFGALLYSTYIGGSGDDIGNSIAVNGSGGIYITGRTTSSNYPTTAGAFQRSGDGAAGDAFVTKLIGSVEGSALLYSTYLGGRISDDVGNGIAVDESGNAYVTGTAGFDFPTTPGAFQTVFSDSSGFGVNTFVAKLNPTGSGLVYSTYLGGSAAAEFGNAIALDVFRSVYVTGRTRSSDFPTTPGAFQANHALDGGSDDAFVTKLNPAGNALVYSTYLGGTGSDIGNSIAVDGSGSALVAGQTNSLDFPMRLPLQPTYGGGSLDAFIAKFDPIGRTLDYSSYLGGGGAEAGNGIAAAGRGFGSENTRTYMTGATSSTDFPSVNPPRQPGFGGGSLDAFLVAVEAILPLAVFDILPRQGGNAGTVSVLIHGTGLRPQTIKLVRSGESDIVGTLQDLEAQNRTAAATFDLTGKALGTWDFVVINLDGTSASLPGAFTIEQSRAPEIWVDIVGRNLFRAGRSQSYTILFGNRGNVDAKGVPIGIAGIPKDAIVELGFNIAPLPDIGTPLPVDPNLLPDLIELENEKVLPLMIPVIPAGFTGALPIRLIFPTPEGALLKTWAATPWFGSPVKKSVVECLGGAAKLALGSVPGVGCVLDAGEFLGTSITEGIFRGTQDPWHLTKLGGEAILSCSPGAVVKSVANLKSLAERLTQLYNGVETIIDCDEATKHEDEHELPVASVFSSDPNDKVGSVGAGVPQYLSGEQPLRYATYFENIETATAPAQEVVVSDQIDIDKMDLSTFSLGPIAFGDKQVVPVPGLREFTTDMDLRPDKNLIVRIAARLDMDTGLATWRFTSIDPATGDLPEDPLAGFLPPNVNPPEGDGSVLFTVMPKQGLPTGTEIRNQASIVFDVNPPIDTPEWLNTLDNDKPTSQVDSVSSGSGLEVKWSGTDEGSGILDYTIFVSEDGGPFTPWVSNTTETSGTFIGTCGKSYRFYSVARDATGNVEDAPASPDAETTLTNCDLAVAKITAPKTVTLTTKNPSRTERVRVEIQNRSPHNEMIPDMATLGNLVSLTVESLGSCAAPTPVLHSGKPQKTLPLTLKPKQKLGVVFDLTFSCANDPAKSTKGSPGHEDYRFSARVNHAALGSLDAHPDDDVCPRSVTPPGVIDPIFGGKFLDKGCGAKKADGTFGGDVKTDVIVKP